jgi:5'-3' exonuclease
LNQAFPCKSSTQNQKTKEILQANKEAIMQFRKLATMDDNVPIDVDREKCVFNFFKGDGSKEALMEIGFVSLVKRLPQKKTGYNGVLF